MRINSMTGNTDRRYQTEEEILREWKNWAESWLKKMSENFEPAPDEIVVYDRKETTR